jgi:hypothetical protein
LHESAADSQVAVWNEHEQEPVHAPLTLISVLPAAQVGAQSASLPQAAPQEVLHDESLTGGTHERQSPPEQAFWHEP